MVGVDDGGDDGQAEPDALAVADSSVEAPECSNRDSIANSGTRCLMFVTEMDDMPSPVPVTTLTEPPGLPVADKTGASLDEDQRGLAEYLGHHDPAFTLRVYSHLVPASHERARQVFDGYLFRPRRGRRNSHGTGAR